MVIPWSQFHSCQKKEEHFQAKIKIKNYITVTEFIISKLFLHNYHMKIILQMTLTELPAHYNIPSDLDALSLVHVNTVKGIEHLAVSFTWITQTH